MRPAHPLGLAFRCRCGSGSPTGWRSWALTREGPGGCLTLCSPPGTTQQTPRGCQPGADGRTRCKGARVYLRPSTPRSLTAQIGFVLADWRLPASCPPSREKSKEFRPPARCPSPCSTPTLYPENARAPQVSGEPPVGLGENRRGNKAPPRTEGRTLLEWPLWCEAFM